VPVPAGCAPMYEFVDRSLARQDRGARLFVWAMRQWAGAALDGRCVCRLVDCAFRSANLCGATEPLHYGMRALCHNGRTPMRFGAVQRASVTEHEAILLSALIAAGRGRDEAVHAICDMMVESSAAPALAASLKALAQAFADAELGFAAADCRH